jgi:tetratricopeptide (TPR) repeat protein
MLLPEYDDVVSKTLMYEKALSSADAGVKKDPGVTGPAQTVYGFIYHKRGQWTRATEAHLRAINANTVYPISHQLYSRLLASVGRLDEALIEARKAHEIEPQQAAQISRLAITYLWVDDLENAETYFVQSDAHLEYKAPVHDLAYSLFHIRNGDYDKAESEAIIGLEKYGSDSSWVAPVYEGMRNPDKRDEALAIVEQIAAGNDLIAKVEISLWVLLGDADRAMEVARRMEDSGEIFEAELLFIPQFSILREHPDFPLLLDAIGLTEYWSDNGCEWQSDHVVCEEDRDAVMLSSD